MRIFSRVKKLEEKIEDYRKKVSELEDELNDLKQEKYKEKMNKKLKEYSEKYERNITVERRSFVYSNRDYLCIDGKSVVVLESFTSEDKYEELCSIENEIKAWLFDEKTKEVQDES